jgi:hypothetical protein
MTIDRLLGSNSSGGYAKGNEHVLFGMLRTNSSSASSAVVLGCCMELEDLTGSIPLQLHLDRSSSGANGNGRVDEEQLMTKIDSRGIYMEGSLVLAHGTYEENGIFCCRMLEFPPLESAADTKQYLPPSPYSNGIDQFEKGNSKPPINIIAMGNLELDDPDCFEQLKGVVESLEWNDSGGDQDQDNDQEGSILVLFGSFKTDTMRLSLALEEVAKIIKASNVSRKHSILILPGPQDVAPNACWPLPAFDKHKSQLSLFQYIIQSNICACIHLNSSELEVHSAN